MRAEGVVADVTSRDSLRAAALETIATFGKVHVVCNNAGVGAGGLLGQVPERDWDWVVDVNLMGVVHGMEIFTPLIASHGEGGHFVNTASMAGMVSPPGMEPYCATKYAVVGMSEGWAPAACAPGHRRLRPLPGLREDPHPREPPQPARRLWSGRARRAASRRAAVAGASAASPSSRWATGWSEAVKANELYIFTHPEFKARWPRASSASCRLRLRGRQPGPVGAAQARNARPQPARPASGGRLRVRRP